MAERITIPKPYQTLAGLLTISLTVGIISVAKPVLMPLALAVLLSFVLTPLVTLVQRWVRKRVVAVLIVVLVGLMMAGGIAWGVGSQLKMLGDELPHQKEKIQAKIKRLSPRGGMVDKLLATFSTDDKEADGAHPTTAPTTAPVVVTLAEKTGLGQYADYAAGALEPAATAFLVLILVVFMLIRREDLRNRIIGLVGHGRLTGTTRVTVEAAHRLSKYLLAQAAVNSAFGIVFGLVLLALGVPYVILWASLTAVLRFVPYVGTWAAAAGPIVLSFAVSDGWGQPIAVFVSFAVLDLTTANVIEPILFGHSTGVSPVALLIAAAFWTWMWGPVGLVLSTPLTVCLVVLGQHAPRLRALSMLLGDAPALDPHVTLYQRLLAGDETEAVGVVRDELKKGGLEHACDKVILPAIVRVRRDREIGGLTANDERVIFDAIDRIIDQLPADEPTAPGSAPLVLACPAHHRSEELSLKMLSRVLGGSGCRVEALPSRMLPVEIERAVERENPLLLVVAVAPPGGLIQARYLCRRLGKRFANKQIIVGYWGKSKDFDRLLRRLRAANASYVTTSLSQTKTQVTALLPSLAVT